MKKQYSHTSMAAFVLGFAAIGTLLLLLTKAAVLPNVSFEAESNPPSGDAEVASDATASDGNFTALHKTSNAVEVPADLLYLSNWKLTLPEETAHAGNPDEILQPELASFTSDSFFKLNSAKNGVTFTAPVGGATTGGSSYPRSELREMTNGGGEAAWSNASGSHSMTIRQAINHAPAVKQHVVVGQIHDAEDDVIMIRLEGTRLFVEQGGNEAGLLDDSYVLGTEFTVTITANAAGIQISYASNGSTAAITLGSVIGNGWYFKAGCYTQSNTDTGDSPADYGEVTIYDLTVTHTN